MVIHHKMVVVLKVELCFGSMVNDSQTTDLVQVLVFQIPIRFNWLMVIPFITVKCTMIKQLLHNWHVTYRHYPIVSIKFVSMSMVFWFHCINTTILHKHFLFQCRVKHQPLLVFHHHPVHPNLYSNSLVHSKHRVIHEMLKDVLKITIHWSLGKIQSNDKDYMNNNHLFLFTSSIFIGGHLCNLVDSSTGEM